MKQKNFGSKIQDVIDWIVKNSLWLAAIGLMIASSGIDGAYMIKFNEWGSFGGYALNTTSDIVGMILMYWFGVFRQSSNQTKKNLAFGLLPAEIVAVLYSWAFSWRQLRPFIEAIETDLIWGPSEVEWLAFFFAGFVPLMLAFVGYAQSLQVSMNDEEIDRKTLEQRVNDLQVQVEKQNWPTLRKAEYEEWAKGKRGKFEDLIEQASEELERTLPHERTLARWRS